MVEVVLEPLKIMSDIINLFDLSPRDQIVAMVTKAWPYKAEKLSSSAVF